MSISTTATKVSYAGNNSNSTPYAITFKYLDVSHVTVYADKVDITTNCTFSGDGAAGTGQFTTDAAQAPTVTVAAVLDVPLDQPVVLQETGSLPAKTLEVSGFDRLNMQIRRVWRKAQDVLTFSSDEGSGSTGTADTLVGFDGSGDIAEIPNGTFCQTANNLSDVTAATARTNLGVDAAGTDNSTDVTLAGTGTYISLGAGQVITVDPITESDISDLQAYITGITGENLTNLSDVTITTPSTGQVLSWNGAAWVNTAAGNGDMLAATYDPSGNAAAIGTTQGVGATTYNIQAADEGAVAGLVRGEYSVDLQTFRTLDTQVASGDNSALIGGRDNTASGIRSAAVGGTDNTAGGTGSFVTGNTNSITSSSNSAIIAGISNDITGIGNNHVVVGGTNNNVSASSSHSGCFAGNNNDVSGSNAAAIGGQQNTVSGNLAVSLGANGGTASEADTIVAGQAGTASHVGSRVFADSTATAISSIADNEFAVQASALRLDDTNQAAGKVLTCDANGSGNWADTTNGTTQGEGVTTYNVQAKDEGTIAGNARGESSVDLQTTRTAATEVASGDYSALVAGQNNTASGAGSFCGGGLDNSASNTRSVVMGGNGNTASGSASVVLGGIGCTASGAETLVAGENATASHNGARLFADNFATAFPSIATQEFAIQASALRLVDGNEGAGKVLTCDANGSGNWAAPSKVVYTVATLPATPAQGDVAMVTDATATTFHSIVSGTGSNIVPVFYDGTNWRIG